MRSKVNIFHSMLSKSPNAPFLCMHISEPFSVRFKDSSQNEPLLFETRFYICELVHLNQKFSKYEAGEGFAGELAKHVCFAEQ